MLQPLDVQSQSSLHAGTAVGKANLNHMPQMDSSMETHDHMDGFKKPTFPKAGNGMFDVSILCNSEYLYGIQPCLRSCMLLISLDLWPQSTGRKPNLYKPLPIDLANG